MGRIWFFGCCSSETYAFKNGFIPIVTSIQKLFWSIYMCYSSLYNTIGFATWWAMRSYWGTKNSYWQGLNVTMLIWPSLDFRPELSNFELKINCRCRSLGERLYQNFVIYVHAHKYKQAPARVNHLKTKENTSIMIKVRKPKLF